MDENIVRGWSLRIPGQYKASTYQLGINYSRAERNDLNNELERR